MPFYLYKHPDTGEVFEDLRPMSRRDDPFVAPDGKECARCRDAEWDSIRAEGDSACTPRGGKLARGLVNRNAEVWEKDPDYARLLCPRRVRLRDGRSVPYNPNTMR